MSRPLTFFDLIKLSRFVAARSCNKCQWKYATSGWLSAGTAIDTFGYLRRIFMQIRTVNWCSSVNSLNEISGLSREADGNCPLLGSYVASACNPLPTFLGYFTPEDGTSKFFSETSVRNYQYTLRNSPEERRPRSVYSLTTRTDRRRQRQVIQSRDTVNWHQCLILLYCHAFWNSL